MGEVLIGGPLDAHKAAAEALMTSASFCASSDIFIITIVIIAVIVMILLIAIIILDHCSAIADKSSRVPAQQLSASMAGRCARPLR